MVHIVPPNPVGLVYYFHGGGGSYEQALSTNQTDAINALTDAGFAVVAYGSADREVKAWNHLVLNDDSTPNFQNEEWLQFVSAREYLIANTDISATTPLFTMGFSSGGNGALAFAYLAQKAGLEVAAVSVHSARGCKPDILRFAPDWDIPVFYAILENDPRSMEFELLREVFASNGVSMEFHKGAERTLTPERFLFEISNQQFILFF